MTADSLFSFLEDDALTIPGVKSRQFPLGKDYVIDSPDAETGARLSALAELATKANVGEEVSDRDRARLQMDDADEREFIVQVLGSVYQEMIDDGVSWVRIQRIGQFAYLHFAFSPEAARDAAEKGALEGKGPALNRAERRAQSKTPGTRKAPADSTATRPRPRATKSRG